MEHPLIPKIEGESLEDMQKTLSSLYKKLRFAQSQGNHFLISQILMAIESYNVAYQKRLLESMPQGDIDDDSGTLLDIS